MSTEWSIITIYLQYKQELNNSIIQISFNKYWMISSLWPQMLSFQPNIFWVPSFSYCPSVLPKVFQTVFEGNNQQMPAVSKQSDELESEHLKEPKRRTWTVDEDQKLLAIISSMNLSDSKRMPYHKIAKEFRGRTSKQIRQRYLNHLNSSINKDPFLKEQDESILKYYTQNGPKWKKLSLMMKGRTPTSLKNRFNTKLKQTLTLCSSSSQQTQIKTDSSSKLFQQNLLDSREKYNSQQSF